MDEAENKGCKTPHSKIRSKHVSVHYRMLRGAYHQPEFSSYSSAFTPIDTSFRQYFDPRLCWVYEQPLSPLDLSIKSNLAPITPPSTPSPKKYTESSLPIRKRNISECYSSSENGFSIFPKSESKYPEEFTPEKKTQLSPKFPNLGKKHKTIKKLNFDEETSSPVSGTIIRQLRDDETLVVRKGDIDPAFNVVEVTEEAKAEIAKIENHIGDYICRLCKELYDDAFQLAQHRCSRIVHVEYRCPECDKVFNCPANLASHRRWHKPKVVPEQQKFQSSEEDSSDESTIFPCHICQKVFRRQTYLKKHLQSHDTSASCNTTEVTSSLLGTPLNIGFQAVEEAK